MADKNYTPLDSYDIKELRLDTRHGDAYDIKNSLIEMNIYASIYEQTMSANLVLVDAINMISTYPIVGGEKITLTFRTKGFKNYIDLKFRVIEIGERVQRAKVSAFTLQLVSESRYQDHQKRFSRGFEMSYGEIINSCHQYFATQPILESDDTNGVVTFASPNWSPLSIIEWCCGRAVDDEGSPMMYWEDLDGFRLKSISKLVSKDVVRKYYSQPQGTTDDIERLLNNVTTFQYLPSRDIQSNRYKGVYNHLENMYNPNLKQFEINKRDYSETFDSNKHLERYPIHKDPREDLDSQCYVWQLFREDNSHIFKYNRSVVANTLSTVSMNLLLPGNYKTRIGDVVEFNPPSPQPSPDGSPKEEQYIKGKFLVTAVCHMIKPESYDMTLELTKDSYSREIKAVKDAKR